MTFWMPRDMLRDTRKRWVDSVQRRAGPRQLAEPLQPINSVKIYQQESARSAQIVLMSRTYHRLTTQADRAYYLH